MTTGYLFVLLSGAACPQHFLQVHAVQPEEASLPLIARVWVRRSGAIGADIRWGDDARLEPAVAAAEPADAADHQLQ